MNTLGIATEPRESSIPSFGKDEVERTHFHPYLALELAEHAACGYSQYLYPARAEHEGGWRWATSVDAGATQLYLAWDEEYGIISCRGSDQSGDWFENGLVCKAENPIVSATGTPFPGRVHGGFSRQFRRVERELERAVGYAKLDSIRGGYKGQKWFVCGHSLGGALAVMVAAYLRCEGLPVQAVYTFGSPRPGDKAWGDWYDEIGLSGITRRVVIVRHGHQDIVTRLPLSAGGWAHVGSPDILLSNGKVEHIEGPGAWRYVRSLRKTSIFTYLRVAHEIKQGAMQHKISLTLEALARLSGIEQLELE